MFFGWHEITTDNLQNPFEFFVVCIFVLTLNHCPHINSGTLNSHISFPK
jgi:hypothetical protein